MEIKKFKNNKIVFKRKRNENFGDFLYNGEIMDSFVYYAVKGTDFWIIDTEKNLYYLAAKNYNENDVEANDFCFAFMTQPSVALYPDKIDNESEIELLKQIKKKYSYNANYSNSISIYTDGACKGNPGEIGIGGVIYDEKQNVLKMVCKSCGYGTNNVAEYTAVINSLQAAKEYSPEKIVVYSDSQLTMHQLSGYFQVKDDNLKVLHNAVLTTVKELDCDVEFVWIQREQNAVADALASRAIGFNNAIITKEGIIAWEKDTTFRSKNENLLEVEPQNISLIAKLNEMDNPKFNDFTCLKDRNVIKSTSGISVKNLLKYIQMRFGEKTATYVFKVLSKADKAYAVNVLAWIAHGLNPDKAFKKVSVDIEMEINKRNKFN